MAFDEDLSIPRERGGAFDFGGWEFVDGQQGGASQSPVSGEGAFDRMAYHAYADWANKSQSPVSGEGAFDRKHGGVLRRLRDVSIPRERGGGLRRQQLRAQPHPDAVRLNPP